MTLKQILGLLIISSPFIIVFIIAANSIGIVAAALIYLGTAALLGFLLLGFKLLGN